MRKHKEVYKAAKRIFDIVTSGIGIVGTAPLWGVAIIGILMSDPGPVFYRANRIGIDNKPFVMFKFRSMRTDRNANEKNFKADTNRIFKWGAFIRKTKIDELPQLLNILKGDMSVVGPRPASKDQVEIVRAGKYAEISKVKPGLTGPAALYDYIYGDTIEDEQEYEERVLPTRMELDIFYAKQMSVFYDIKMIWWTVISIFNSITHRNSDGIFAELKQSVEILNS